MENTFSHEAHAVSQERPSEKLSAERRQEMLNEGWDLDAFDALFMDPPTPWEPPRCPVEVFGRGFHVRAHRPLFGYIVEVWLHANKQVPEQLPLRPRSAALLAEAIKAAVSGLQIPEDAGCDIADAPFYVARRGHRILVGTAWYGVSLTRKRAAEFADELQTASVAHLT